MKALAALFSIATGAAAVPGLALAAAAAASACSAPPDLPPDMLARAGAPGPYPTFCSIPPTPSGVRSPEAFRGAVVSERLSGVRLVRQTGPSTWSLEGTADFEAVGKAQAAPPPPITTDEATEAFIREMRAKAEPPPRPR